MRREAAVVIAIAALAGCHGGQKASPELLQHLQTQPLYTCCNIHYQGEETSDANYFVGSTIPVATAVKIEAATEDSVTVSANGQKVKLRHLYGAKEETHQQYFDKILVPVDRSGRIAKFSPGAQKAIQDGRVQRGMTREQTVLSLGFPPSDETPSPKSSEWVYYYGKGQKYTVVFDERGIVTNVVGRPAPTKDLPPGTKPRS